MDKERNLGVTEARFALTIVTCLVFAIGYIALLRLGGARDPTVDIGPGEISPPSMVGPVVPPATRELPPVVLTLEKPDELAKRPEADRR